MQSIMKKSVIYSRVSTEDQDTESQFKDLKNYAKKNGYKVIKTFGEKVSAVDVDLLRIQYENMKVFVLKNDIKHVLIWELSRLGRNNIHTLRELKFYKEKKINIYFKKENINTNDPSSEFLLDILSATSSLETRTLKERMARGRISNIEKGKKTGFPIMPYGYTSDKNNYLIVNEDEAKVICQIYDLYVLGNAMYKIANTLNSLNIPTRRELSGKKRKLKNKEVKYLWGIPSVRKILQNPLYKGERHYRDKLKNRELIIKVPAIISDIIWDNVQKGFKNHIGYANATNYSYLLKSKITCGRCGRTYMSHTEKKRKGIFSFYFCSGRLDRNIRCKNGQIKSTILDKFVYNLILQHSDMMLAIHKESMEKFNLKEKEQQIEYYKSEIIKQGAKKKIEIKLLRDGHTTESVFDKEINSIRNAIIEFDKNISSIQREIDTFKGYNPNDDWMKLTNLSLETNFEAKREFIQKYLDKVLINKVDKCDLDFTELNDRIITEPNQSIEEIKEVSFTRKFKRNPHGNDNIKYIEIFAFGNEKPIKAVVTQVTEICYDDDNLVFDDGRLKLDKKISKDPREQYIKVKKKRRLP